MHKRYKVNELNIFWKSFIRILISIYISLCIVPFLLVIMVSLTDERTLAINGYSFFPEKFSIAAYQFAFSEGAMILKAYGITIIVTLIGTFFGVLITSLYSYAISRRDFKFGKFFTRIAAFTMLFNGGLVPWYLVCTQFLHLRNTLAALIIPYLVNAFYIIIMKTFFKNSVPDSIVESAKLDGAGEFRIFFSIVTRISLPAFATVALFLALNYWNDWWLPMMLIEKKGLLNLQFLLYRIQNNLAYLSSGMVKSSYASSAIGLMPAESARMAMAVMAVGPVILFYPFVQKYFVKGLTLGAVKG